MAVLINKDLCPQNHPCPAVKICPVDALTQIRNAAPEADADACIDCGKCVETCPMGVFKIE